jgi:hypothetical protein
LVYDDITKKIGVGNCILNLKNISDSEVNELIESLKFPKKILGLQEACQRVAELFQILFDSEIIDEDNDVLKM